MSRRLTPRLFEWLGAFLLGVIACLVLVSIFGTTNLVYEYQSLVGGLLAFFASIIAAGFLWWQIELIQKHRKEDLSTKQYAARSILLAHLFYLDQSVNECLAYLARMHKYADSSVNFRKLTPPSTLESEVLNSIGVHISDLASGSEVPEFTRCLSSVIKREAFIKSHLNTLSDALRDIEKSERIIYLDGEKQFNTLIYCAGSRNIIGAMMHNINKNESMEKFLRPHHIYGQFVRDQLSKYSEFSDIVQRRLSTTEQLEAKYIIEY
ncbi:MAG: hypothetical protein H6843_09155 [Rhodospirillaceae bacterium]|nr:hypothetical protein [Rhodospirillaceae bacterium]